MLSFTFVLAESFKEAFIFYLDWWWFFTPLVLWPIFELAWVSYVQEKHIRSIKWKLLEIKIPKEIEKRPKTMEEFFSSIYSTFDIVIDTLYDVYLKGTVDVWFSLEIVGIEGDVRFYIRTPVESLEMIEAQIYAQYPEAEIKEVDDYVADIPDDMPNKDYEIWGTDMKLKKEDAYPIRIYKEFEDQASGEFVDPISNIVEGAGKLCKGEQIWMQILIRATNDDWKIEADALVLKLIGRKEKNKKGEGIFSFIINEIVDLGRYTLLGFFSPQSLIEKENKKEEKEQVSMMLHLSPGEKEVVTAIGDSTKRPGYETDIRWIYLAKKDIFDKSKGNAVVFSYLSQFGSQDLNSFVPDGRTKTSAYYFFTNHRKNLKRKRILKRYKRREFDKKSYVLNTEELATLFHFPTIEVKAPLAPRVEAKKGKPPTGLPV
ncbi:MAG: hypothetical protein U9P70_03955 [Patescibacteria group bacterium]|nr:hypothetical protein [Patescibacteria group bacterium]